MNSVRAVLFDLDGTLFDSKQAVVDAVYRTAEQHAPGTLSYAEVESRFGEAWDSFIPQLGCCDKDKVVETYMEFIRKTYVSMVSPFPGVKTSLEILKGKGYQLALVTNNQKYLAIQGLVNWDMDGFFDCMITADDVVHGKPHPEPIERVCRQLNLNKKETIMVGDTVYDAKAAHAAGIKCAIIDWYRRYPHAQWQPDYYLGSIGELINRLLLTRQREAV